LLTGRCTRARPLFSFIKTAVDGSRLLLLQLHRRLPFPSLPHSSYRVSNLQSASCVPERIPCATIIPRAERTRVYGRMDGWTGGSRISDIGWRGRRGYASWWNGFPFALEKDSFLGSPFWVTRSVRRDRCGDSRLRRRTPRGVSASAGSRSRFPTGMRGREGRAVMGLVGRESRPRRLASRRRDDTKSSETRRRKLAAY